MSTSNRKGKIMSKIKPYEFTLVLDGVDENTPLLEDHLFECGCDDALINFRNGAVYLDFTREASSFEKAVFSAIKDIESSKTEARVVTVAPEDLVTESDIAKRVHKPKQTISLWVKGSRRTGSNFPKPCMKLSDKSPFWRWREVAKWLYQNHIVQEKEIVNNAVFIESLNKILDDRDPVIRRSKKTLLNKVEKISNLVSWRL